MVAFVLTGTRRRKRMSRFTSYWQLAAWLVLAGVFFWPLGAAGEDRGSTASGRVVSPTEAIEHALLQPATFNFVEAPLTDVAEFVREKFEIEVVLDRVALEAAGVALDVPITKQVRGISLRSGLNLALRDLDLTWVVQDEVLLITTRDEAEQIIATKVYPVRVLALRPGDSGGEDYNSLVAAIVTTIAPTTWSGVGGPGSLQAVPYAGAIVVAQTQAVHEEVSALLKSLRDARTKQFQTGVTNGPTERATP